MKWPKITGQFLCSLYCSLLSKGLERVAHEQLNHLLASNNMLSQGPRRGRGTFLEILKSYWEKGIFSPPPPVHQSGNKRLHSTETLGILFNQPSI